jgi:protein subunit release factor A
MFSFKSPRRVYEQERQKSVALRSELRSLSNGTGDRTDKIRTYNFPQVRHFLHLLCSGLC